MELGPVLTLGEVFCGFAYIIFRFTCSIFENTCVILKFTCLIETVKEQGGGQH